MYITRPAALPLFRSCNCPTAFSSALDTQGMTQTHTGAYELALARDVRVAMKTVLTALAWLYSYMCMYIGVCLPPIYIYVYTYVH